MPERTNYITGVLYLLAGLFFSIYPICGILKNDLVIVVRPGGIPHHMHGVDAIVVGTGVCFLGLSLASTAVKNILDWRKRSFYVKPAYAGIQALSSRLRSIGVIIMLLWGAIGCVSGLLA